MVADSGDAPAWRWHANNGLSRVVELVGGDTLRKRFLLTDHLGTVQTILDDTGAVVARYQLDPYGNLESYQGSVTTALLYTGKAFDPDLGKWYFNARFYDAERGAFIGRDPKLQFWTPYSYVRNWPLTSFDPDGMAQVMATPSSGINYWSMVGWGWARGTGTPATVEGAKNTANSGLHLAYRDFKIGTKKNGERPICNESS